MEQIRCCTNKPNYINFTDRLLTFQMFQNIKKAPFVLLYWIWLFVCYNSTRCMLKVSSCCIRLNDFLAAHSMYNFDVSVCNGASCLVDLSPQKLVFSFLTTLLSNGQLLKQRIQEGLRTRLPWAEHTHTHTFKNTQTHTQATKQRRQNGIWN